MMLIQIHIVQKFCAYLEMKGLKVKKNSGF